MPIVLPFRAPAGSPRAVIIGSITVVGPVLFYLFAQATPAGALNSIKQFMSDHNAVIMMVVLLILGAKILGQGIGGLTD